MFVEKGDSGETLTEPLAMNILLLGVLDLRNSPALFARRDLDGRHRRGNLAQSPLIAPDRRSAVDSRSTVDLLFSKKPGPRRDGKPLAQSGRPRFGASTCGALGQPVKPPKPAVRRRRSTTGWNLALVVVMLFITGCFHAPAPYLPTQWPATSESLETLSDRQAHPVLQVLIAYNAYWPNHTALRLVEKDGQTLFWDPGGGFGKDTTTIVRRSDLIMEDAPSLIAYMPYRWSHNDQAVEIFEWALSAAEAQRMADTLRTGAGRTDYSQAGFRTATPGLFCNAAVSSFLYDYGRPSLSLGDSYLLPNLLSRELYTRHPDRVMIIKRDNRSTVLVLRPPQAHRKVAALPFSETP